MKAYWYQVLGNDGKIRRGIVRLPVERDFSVRLWLEKQHGGVVVALRRLPGWLGSLGGRGRVRGITAEQLGGLLRDLAVMIGAGISMLEALQTLAEENRLGGHPRVAQLAAMLGDDLDAGLSVSDAFARHQDIFPDTVRNLVMIGDETGAMDRMLMEAAQHIERLSRMGRDVRQAMIYPLFVIGTIFAAAAFWVYYVIPNLAQLFQQMQATLPPLTLAVLAVSDWLTTHVTVTLTGVGVCGGGLWIGLRRSLWLRRRAYALAHRLPVLRTLMYSSGMAFISEHLALLIRSGIDLVTSLGILELATRDEYYRQRIHAARRVLERGERLANAMRQVGGFPPMAVRMIAVGEETGTLDDQLGFLATEYRQRLEHLIGSLSEIIKPLIILVAGALFLLLVGALLLPVYDLVRQAVTAY